MMSSKTRACIVSLAVILVLALAQAGFAASALTVSPAGDGVFVLQGTMENVSGIDVTVSYDAAALANPRVDNGALISGALTAVNANMPGAVRIAVVRVQPIQGSGVIATLTFSRRGGGAGRVTALTARLTSLDGAQIPVLTQIINPADAGATASGTAAQGEAQREAQRETQRDSSAPSPSAAPSPVPVPPGPMVGVVVPQPGPGGTGDQPGAGSPQELTAGPGPETEASSEPPVLARKEAGEAAPLSQAPEKKIHALTSVLERFRDYRGERTAKNAMAQFEQDAAIGFRQEPPIALADGKSTVTVVFISDPGTKSASDVAVVGAQLVSLKKDPDYTNTWIAELKPDRDAYKASFTVSLEKFTIVFPLTVAPKLDIDLDRSGKVTETDFALFLMKKGTSAAPEYDLNKDGRRDYLDDYIFTANYLTAVKGR